MKNITIYAAELGVDLQRHIIKQKEYPNYFNTTSNNVLVQREVINTFVNFDMVNSTELNFRFNIYSPGVALIVSIDQIYTR